MDASATHAPADKSTLIYVREFHHRGDSVVLPGRMVNTFKVSIVLSCGLQWKWSHRNSQHYYIGSTRGTQLSVTFISTSRYRLPWCYLRCNLGRRDSSRSCRNREGRPFRSLYSQSLIDSSGLTWPFNSCERWQQQGSGARRSTDNSSSTWKHSTLRSCNGEGYWRSFFQCHKEGVEWIETECINTKKASRNQRNQRIVRWQWWRSGAYSQAYFRPYIGRGKLQLRFRYRQCSQELPIPHEFTLPEEPSCSRQVDRR